MRAPRQPRPAADVRLSADEPGEPVRRRASVLVELAGFAQARRALGVARAATLASELAERIAAVLPTAAVAPIARDLVEVGVAVADEVALQAVVADLRACSAAPGQTLCIGAAIAGEADHDPVALAEAAEAALAQARAAGGSEPKTVATPAPTTDATLGAELRQAIARDELFPHYQPKLHLRRQEITSLEALIRWRHPERGLVMPGQFIPVAERSGAIKAMTLWTLRRVMADQRTLARNGHDLPIFINIAGVLLSDPDFVAQACALVEESGARLGFEITETSVIREPELAIQHLNRFAGIGVAITIDDYGAGLSSLAYLKQLPARELKIDKLFVTQLASSHRDPLIVRSTIDLAHALEMEVVAEGVETASSLALLSVMGCDMVQGFLICRPLPIDGLLAYLREAGHRDLLQQSRSPLQRLAAVKARA